MNHGIDILARKLLADERTEHRHRAAAGAHLGHRFKRNVSGITFMDDISGVKHNYSYFPIFVDEERYGMSRDELYFKMKEYNVLGRRYFYPLISTFSTYRELKSARKENLPVATKMAEQVICLPMHHALSEDDMERVLRLIRK